MIGASGGTEVTMEDLVRLTLHWLITESAVRFAAHVRPSARGRSIMMPEAAFLTLRCLTCHDPKWPRLFRPCRAGFLKTGTSHGFRVTHGQSPSIIMCCGLIGNFDGRANGTFVGRIAAALFVSNYR
jgi:membrane carboxypeptidase/penicillin-binding protein PbpC